MQNNDISAFRATLDKISSTYYQTNCAPCMELRSGALKNYAPILTAIMKLTLSQFIGKRSEKLSDHSSTGQISDPSCSFLRKEATVSAPRRRPFGVHMQRMRRTVFAILEISAQGQDE